MSRMKEQGQGSNWNRKIAIRGSETVFCAFKRTRTLAEVKGRKKAQGSPPCGPARRAIILPGSETHSHQLGSNPVDTITQFSNFTSLSLSRQMQVAPAVLPPAGLIHRRQDRRRHQSLTSLRRWLPLQ